MSSGWLGTFVDRMTLCDGEMLHTKCGSVGGIIVWCPRRCNHPEQVGAQRLTLVGGTSCHLLLLGRAAPADQTASASSTTGSQAVFNEARRGAGRW